QDVPGQLLPLELRQPLARPRRHGPGMIDPGPRRHHPDRASITALQPEGLTRRAHPDLDFRAHPHPAHMRGEDLNEKRISLVAAVEADLVAEEARGNAEPGPIVRLGIHWPPRPGLRQ